MLSFSVKGIPRPIFQALDQENMIGVIISCLDSVVRSSYRSKRTPSVLLPLRSGNVPTSSSCKRVPLKNFKSKSPSLYLINNITRHFCSIAFI